VAGGSSCGSGDDVRNPRWAGAVAGWFARLDPSPDVFAVVMATGIVAIAARDHGYWYIDTGLGLVALAAFAVLGLGFVIRVTTHPSRVVQLTRNPDVALRMFTFSAACIVLGEQVRSSPIATGALDGIAAAGWCVLVPLTVVDLWSRRTTQLREQAHGAWLLPSVATSGLAGATAQWAANAHATSLVVVAAALVALAIGIYLAVASLIVWQALSGPLHPDQIPPDSWILMGALAISALASSGLLAATRALDEPPPVVDFGRTLALVVWIAASLWVPVLLYAQMWRSDHLPGTLHYEGVWWSAVFPIGMYSAATSAVGAQLELPQLATVSLVFFWIAFTIFVLVGTGLVHAGAARAAALGRLLRPARRSPDR
jgi:tellurite resistance protein TehA-like permease